jgi:hypothetical protein
MPSRNGVRATKPKSRSAREVSSLRRGCPFGVEVSQTISPWKPVSLAITSASSLIDTMAGDERLETLALEPFDEMRAEEAVTASDKIVH